MICYPLLPEPFYYASPEQQTEFYGTKEKDQKRLQANIDIFSGEFMSLATNVRAWVSEEVEGDVNIQIVYRKGEGGVEVEHNAENLQEGLDYLVTMLWLGVEVPYKEEE